MLEWVLAASGRLCPAPGGRAHPVDVIAAAVGDPGRRLASMFGGLEMMRRGGLSEYVRGSLWVLPTLSVLVALVAGSLLSLVQVGSGSPLAFQGTADDARTLLIGITGTMVTVIALLLGLTVVALQLSSTQF